MNNSDFQRLVRMEEHCADMPWSIIKSMRNLIVHAYHKIDLDTIWETATEDIPKVAKFCKTILEENPQ